MSSPCPRPRRDNWRFRCELAASLAVFDSLLSRADRVRFGPLKRLAAGCGSLPCSAATEKTGVEGPHKSASPPSRRLLLLLLFGLVLSLCPEFPLATPSRPQADSRRASNYPQSFNNNTTTTTNNNNTQWGPNSVLTKTPRPRLSTARWPSGGMSGPPSGL